MEKGIYIANTEAWTGKSIIALGLMKMLLAKTSRVGYFRPIISDHAEGEKDNHIETMISYFDLDIKYENSYGYTLSEVVAMKNADKEDLLIDGIIGKYKEIESKYDFVLVEGSDFLGKGVAFEFDLNIEIAKNLSLPTIIISSAYDKSLSDAVSNLELAVKSYADEDVVVQAVFMNKIEQGGCDEMAEELRKVISSSTEIGVIPMEKKLSSPTISEINEALDGKILFGETLMNKRAEVFHVGAMQLRNYLPRMGENCLMVTPGDRAEIIIGALQANASVNYPNISGIVLTGGLMPEDSILKLIDGLPGVVPIISVKDTTFAAANKVGNVKSKIRPSDKRKIELSINTFDKYVNTDTLVDKFKNFESDIMTPRMFQYKLVSKAKSSKKHIVLPEGSDSRILEAAIKLVNQNVVDITLLGNRDNIMLKANALKLNLDEKKIKIIDPISSEYFEDYWKTYYEIRKHKNVSETKAKDIMLDVSYFGTMMVHKGHADGMVSGAVNTTAHTIIPSFQFIKTKPGVSTVSSVFFMCLADHVSVFGDCAVNVNPNADQLAEIAISSAESAKAFGIKPKVALLSYSSGSSGTGEQVDKVREATEKAKIIDPELMIEGPIQYDAAVDPTVGKSKMPNSEVAGQATVLVFPDLNTGNNTYKAVQRETGAVAIGPMLQGLNKPVNDLSRGCTVDDIFNTVVITAIQAQDEE
ncbi:MAG: phosphate acetyltransferase [Flavobacteriales bacterium]|nr:phosphate acetyltransferase [Flavobacteriales bacterium]